MTRMNDTITLRDHSKPCEHEDNRFGDGAELLFDIDEYVCKRSDCPGGKEIILRLEEVDLAPDAHYPKWRHVWVEVDNE